jgi:outer membrane receptor protein involved in Fe transport
MRKTTLRHWLAGGAAAGALAVAFAAQAQDTTFAFNQPELPLAEALQAVGHQTGANILIDSRLARGLRAQPLKGELTADGALMALLDGTGLTAERTDRNSILIRKVTADPQGSSAAGGGAEVEALIVTAQKREEDIQDVPIAISAFSQEDLTRSQVAGGPDLITQVPNMTFTKTNFSSYSIQLRGIGTQAISATTDPAVAVAFNNTPFIRNRFFEQEFYDLQRVEVLRGPQGTLYGRNATAGVVNIISQKPKFVAEAKGSADIGNFSSSRIEGMVNIPLVEDMVAVRLAGAWTKRDGYATNELTGNPIDGRDLWSTRLSLRVSPTDRIEANLIWEHFEEEDDRLRSGKQLCKKAVVTEVAGIPTTYFQTLQDRGQSAILSGVQATFSQGCERNSLYAPDSFQTPNGLMLPYYIPLSSIGLPTALPDPYVSAVQSPDLRVIESTIDPIYKAKSDIGELQISFDLSDKLTLSSETAYGTDWVYSLQDFNRFNTAPGAWRYLDGQGNFTSVVERGILDEQGFFCDPQLGCSNRLIAVDVSTAEARQFSQEFRLSSDFEGPFNFSLGANYLRADSKDKYYVFINSLSMMAAISATNFGIDYEGGVSDNSECLGNWYAPGNPRSTYAVTACTYIDPNPIEQVNDQGHNYFLSNNPYKLISYAVFGEAYYQIADNLKVTAGLRWTVDKKDAPRVPTWLLTSQSYGYPVAEVVEQEWREPTGRLAMDWKPELSFTDETLLYASYAHGYKAGGANPPGFVRVYYAGGDRGAADALAAKSETRPVTFEPEFVDAFELGAKNTLADGRVTLNLAAFYYDYKAYQISEIVDRSAYNRNFDATVWGIEMEADWRPLENLRIGVKGGYEKTRIADGERAIDLMDRTAGKEGWVVVRPFPTIASSCVLPTIVFVTPTGLANPGGVSGGNAGACELAYQYGLDPVTNAPYGEITDPSQFAPPFTGYTGYPGFDPLDESQGHNGGEGFFKELGGNALPNAPEWTATITADYTIPMPHEWLATLHTDLHWQAESWWRVFNDHEYDKLDEYFTMNLAAIFTNEERGWNIMAYVKNVTDETAITGAFLNSDDTGLTTNVFLTEPRLYGLRVTKAWTGGPLLGSFGQRHDGPYPFTLELSGQLQRHDTPDEILIPSFYDEFPDRLATFDDAQNDDLDWGDGRAVKLTWNPAGSPWSVSAAYRSDETNGAAGDTQDFDTPPKCAFVGPLAFVCEAAANDPTVGPATRISVKNWSRPDVIDREKHQIIDLAVGHALSGLPFDRSTVSMGLRHAKLESSTNALLQGVPDWFVGDIFVESTHTRYQATLNAERSFEGFGPIAAWDASYSMLDGDFGRVAVDWGINGGVLFGDRSASVQMEEEATTATFPTFALALGSAAPTLTPAPVAAPIDTSRKSGATVPVLGASLGLSYKAGGFKVGAGYRWERYMDAIDGGIEEEREADRTIDGPYFKIAVGFGG